MSGLSKVEYLKRYMSDSNKDAKKQKKRRKKLPSSEAQVKKKVVTK